MRGMTLLELLVTLAILSILAAAALPYAEMTIVRGKELELKRSLREIRTAIDRFHADWATGKISKLSDATSDDGYPKTLNSLVAGVELAQAKGGKAKYLRRIPEDPFAVGADTKGGLPTSGCFAATRMTRMRSVGEAKMFMMCAPGAAEQP